MNAHIVKFGAMHAAGTVGYVALVATILSNIPAIFGSEPKETILIPIAMLLLFIVSATITGSLVLGRPILWYLDGKKKDAVMLLVAILGWLFFMTMLLFLGIALLG